MADTPNLIRIAIILNRETASCLPLLLPYSAAGYPLVDIEFFQGRSPDSPTQPSEGLSKFQPEAETLGLVANKSKGCLRPLSGLEPKTFDLILDWQQLVPELPAYPQEGLYNLITGPGTPILERVLCQFQELRQKHEINSGILFGGTDAIVTINENHQIVGYNLGAETIFGYSRSEALGKDLSIIIPPPHKEGHRDYVRRYLATRSPHVIGKHVQLNAQRRDGAEFPISISFSVAEVQGDLYFTGIVRDITEYKHMEERLLQSERLAAVGNTVSHIAHEIKNPLAIIGGFARQLQKTPGLDDKGQHKLGIIMEEVARLESMIAEMRDFVRRPPAKKEPGDLEMLLDEVVDLFEDAFQEHNITLKREKAPGAPRIIFDRQQMHQVLINLFKNALEAMPHGGELTLATKIIDPNLEVSISDNGQGMTPEVQANIFQPYFTTKEKGTGLGLAICQNIVEEHGGCIIADSTAGQGSTFTIQIPLERAAPE
ncbi:MAG: ATP-binding protein [Desulfobaccales bacterium]